MPQNHFETASFVFSPHGFRTPSGTRTLDPLIKSQLLYVFSPHGFRTPSGTRTLDPLIKSQLLYQLS